MMNMLYSSIIATSILFMQMNHPLAMGLTLMIQTVIISMITGMISKTFWFSYILFLVFMGGMLVLFIYVTSLASNEMFSMSMQSLMTTMIMFMFMLLLMTYMNKLITNKMFNNNEMLWMNKLSYMNINSMELNKLYNQPTNSITIMLMIYLLITLIAVVKITNLFKGPLRTTF